MITSHKFFREGGGKESLAQNRVKGIASIQIIPLNSGHHMDATHFRG